MEIEITSDTIIVYPAGHVDLHGAQTLEPERMEILAKNPDRNLIVNMKGVHYLSSSGIRVFHTINRRLEEGERLMSLCELSAPVKKVLEVVDMAKYFLVRESEAEAIAATTAG